MWGTRHALPTTWSAPTPRASCCGPGRPVRNWKPGDRVTVHCNYVDDQDPSAHDDSMLAANQRIWGFESNFGGLADLAVVKANQLMPKPGPPELGGGGGQRPVQLDRLPHAGVAQRGPHEAGRQGARLGGQRRPRRLRRASTCSTAAARPSAWCPRPRRWSCSTTSASRRSSTARRPATGSGPTSTPRTSREWRRLGKDIRGLVGEDPDIVFEHPGRQTMGASVFACKRGGTIVTCAATIGLHDRVRQPPPVDEAQDDQGLALRQLPGGVGRQPADLRRARSSPPCRPSTRSTRWARPPTRSTTTCTRARSACCAWRPQEGLGIDDPEFRAEVGEDRITLFRRHGA